MIIIRDQINKFITFYEIFYYMCVIKVESLNVYKFRMKKVCKETVVISLPSRYRSYDQPTKQCLLSAVQVATHRFEWFA